MSHFEHVMAEISSLYAAFGDRDYVGEAITQLEHALQAAKCAVDAGCSDAVVIASLLHDTGHLVGLRDTSLERMGEFGIVKHEIHGQSFCDRLGFPKVVGVLVAGHVDAKRFLCWKNPAYLRKLSPASTATLGFQGGPMGDEEGLKFEANPLFKAILKMRTFDEAAKVVGLVVPGLETYGPRIQGLLEAAASGVDVPVKA